MAAHHAAAAASVLVLGSEGCGKSSLVQRLLDDGFEEAYRPSLGLEMALHEAQTPAHEKMHLQLWCASGQSRFLPVVQHQYASARAVVLVYDRTSARSFEALSFWHAERERGCPDAPLVVVGTKSDLTEDVAVSEDEGRAQAALWGAPHFDVSAKTGRNVGAAMEAVVEVLCR